MKATATLILCLECVYEEMWTKTSSSKCYVFKKKQVSIDCFLEIISHKFTQNLI